MSCTISLYLSDVVFVQASLQPDPGLGFQVGDLFDHLQDICHLFNGNHLLVPEAHPQVADTLDGSLHVRLLIRLHVDVTFDVIWGDDRLDLEGLWAGGGGTVTTVFIKVVSVKLCVTISNNVGYLNQHTGDSISCVSHERLMLD